MADTQNPVRIAMVLFPNLTLLDLVGPYEVLNFPPTTQVDVLWHSLDPVPAAGGLHVTPTSTFEEYDGVPDVIFVPGGPGLMDAMQDQALLDYLARTAPQSQYITAVCTGSLILGAAGLLKGKKATSHWASHHILSELGATPVQGRVVVDGNILTGGGVTAGVDFGFTLLAHLFGDDVAKRVQLMLEYDPKPPFDSGSPETASPELLEQATTAMSGMTAKRKELAEQIGREKLGL